MKKTKKNRKKNQKKQKKNLFDTFYRKTKKQTTPPHPSPPKPQPTVSRAVHSSGGMLLLGWGWGVGRDPVLCRSAVPGGAAPPSLGQLLIVSEPFSAVAEDVDYT